MECWIALRLCPEQSAGQKSVLTCSGHVGRCRSEPCDEGNRIALRIWHADKSLAFEWFLQNDGTASLVPWSRKAIKHSCKCSSLILKALTAAILLPWLKVIGHSCECGTLKINALRVLYPGWFQGNRTLLQVWYVAVNVPASVAVVPRKQQNNLSSAGPGHTVTGLMSGLRIGLWAEQWASLVHLTWKRSSGFPIYASCCSCMTERGSYWFILS